jgi:hypothetical protein
LNTSKEFDHKTIRDVFQVFIAANDADAFIDLCQSVKAEAMLLISQDRCIEAKHLTEVYSNVFRLYACENPSFTLKILPVFPPNSGSTMRLLGINDEIDAFILEHKTDLSAISQGKDNASLLLIEWALSKKDMAYVEKVILGVADHLHAVQAPSSVLSKISCSILYALLFHDERETVVCTPAIDEALAGLITDNKGAMTPDEDYYLMLARSGMRKSLMKALELQSFNISTISRVENRDALFAALPENLTAKEMYWIFRAIEIQEVEGIEEKILFDERVDIQEHIEVLKSSRPIFNDLCITTLERFSHLFNVVATDESKNRRAATFLNAICEAERDRVGRERCAEDIHNDLLELDIDPFFIRQVKMLRGVALEDALGL